MSWESEEKLPLWTRREWVRSGMALGSVGAAATVGAFTYGQLIPPPFKFEGEIRETIHYTKFPTPQWWNRLQGQLVRVTDFELWQGATGVWRGLFTDDRLVPGTGLPVLIMRVARDTTAFQEPLPADIPAPLPEGFSLYFDDEARDLRIVVCFDRCVHLCCFPGWHVVDDPPPGRDYSNYMLPGEDWQVETPTFAKFGQDPIYCVCHGSQYEPMNLVVDTHPKGGARYVGAKRVHGPASRALAVVPVKPQGAGLVGGMADPRWYVYC
jgi:Rieske Fe-S protein